MDFFAEFLAEVFFELFGEGFVSLCSAFLPHKKLSQKTMKWVSFLFFSLAFLLMFGVIAGFFLLEESGGKSVWGWLLLALGAVYVICGIALKIASVLNKKDR